MVVENEVLPYWQWLWRGEGAALADGEGAIVRFGIIVLTLFVLALVGGFIVSLIRNGPVKAGELTYRTLVGGVGDLLRISPRRVGALAWLAIKESLRRRVWVALVVFGLILLSSSWFLGANFREPAPLYISLVTGWASLLVLLTALLTAAFSLPNDIKQKTIYTVATKPVRPIDIVLGRMLGFTAIGTALLAIMAVGSWFFVNGSLAHTHTIDKQSLTTLRDADGGTLGQEGETSVDAFHKHPIDLNAEGDGLALAAHGHTHALSGAAGDVTVGEAQEYLRARVPKRGKIQFYNQQGVPVSKGISVGNEWAYRSFIQGASQAAAVWTFEGVKESTLQEDEDGGLYLPVSVIVRVYRSYKGVIEEAIQGSIQLRNPDTKLKSTLRVFPAKDFEIDTFDFANEQTDTNQNEITILDDLVSEDGRIEVIVQCLDRGQYFGFAQADCYLRLPEGSPLWNFVKGYLAIWMQMVIVIAIAVTMSTFLSGPIAMVASVSFILLGFFRAYFLKIALGESYGGGPVESFVRLVTQMNVMSPFPERTSAVVAMEAVDNVFKTAMRAVSYVLPDFSQYLDRVSYVAAGFSIPTDALGRDLTVCLAYVVGMAIAGYFCLRTREVAK